MAAFDAKRESIRKVVCDEFLDGLSHWAQPMVRPCLLSESHPSGLEGIQHQQWWSRFRAQQLQLHFPLFSVRVTRTAMQSVQNELFLDARCCVCFFKSSRRLLRVCTEIWRCWDADANVSTLRIDSQQYPRAPAPFDWARTSAVPDALSCRVLENVCEPCFIDVKSWATGLNYSVSAAGRVDVLQCLQSLMPSALSVARVIVDFAFAPAECGCLLCVFPHGLAIGHDPTVDEKLNSGGASESKLGALGSAAHAASAPALSNLGDIRASTDYSAIPRAKTWNYTKAWALRHEPMKGADVTGKEATMIMTRSAWLKVDEFEKVLHRVRNDQQSAAAEALVQMALPRSVLS